jgi:hypothetical protein
MPSSSTVSDFDAHGLTTISSPGDIQRMPSSVAGCASPSNNDINPGKHLLEPVVVSPQAVTSSMAENAARLVRFKSAGVVGYPLTEAIRRMLFR